MKNPILLVLLLFTVTTTFSQNFKVVYDAQDGTLSYFLNEEEIAAPIVKKGQKITLEVKNYNNYLYDVDIAEKQEQVKIGEGNNILAGLQPLGGASLASLPNISMGEEITDSDSDGVIDFMDVILDVQESQEAKMIRLLKEKAESKLKSISYQKQQFLERNTQLQGYGKVIQFNAVALEEYRILKYDPNVSPKKIKTIGINILSRALNVNPAETVSLSKVIERNNQAEELKTIAVKHELQKSNYQKEVSMLEELQSQLTNLAPDKPDLFYLYFDLENTISEAPVILEGIQNTSVKIDALIERFEDRSLQEIMNMWYEYEGLHSNTFSKTYITNADADRITFDITFKRKSDIPENSTATESIPVPPIKLSVYGGLKINASIGINFAQFFDQPKMYFVRDSILIGQSGDRFIPMITSFLHFYRQSNRTISFGGSLGLGIPIGGEGLESTSFFVGPSLFFGQSDRFVLNTGIMGGKVKRLTAGYKEGDFYEGANEFIPIESFYNLGYFVGLSFNLR